MLGRECLTQRTETDVASDVAYVAVVEAGVVEASNGIVDIETVLGAGCGLDLPANQGHLEGFGHGFGQQGFARSRLAAHQQGALEREGAVNGRLEAIACQVSLSSAESEEVALHVGALHRWSRRAATLDAPQPRLAAHPKLAPLGCKTRGLLKFTEAVQTRLVSIDSRNYRACCTHAASA